jgi:hypothetical protein
MSDQKSPAAADPSRAMVPADILEDVTCPGDPRCGSGAAVTEKFPTMCTAKKTRAVAYLCGTDPTARRRCPGDGCPTGQPRPEDKCLISLRVTEVDCKNTIDEIVVKDEAAPGDPSPPAAE